MNVIVVGVDGSETAAAAATEAARLAEATGARLHLVTALVKQKTAVVEAPGGAWQTSTLDQAEQLLADLAQRLVPPGVECTTAAVSGKPAEVVVSEAERLDASLIVVGNRRMQGAARVLGSVASDVAHHAPCSVYIAKTT
jgi:nucleotide-binding universal stress UspA family protein